MTSTQSNSDVIVIDVRGLGPVPAKKNSKMIAHGFLITKPEYQEWIKRFIQAIRFQLSSTIQTSEGEMPMAHLAQSSMRWLPQDDSWMDINIGFVDADLVEKGQEGVTIYINLNPKPHWRDQYGQKRKRRSTES